MSRTRFLTDHDFNERILRGLERREPTIEIVRLEKSVSTNDLMRRFWRTPRPTS